MCPLAFFGQAFRRSPQPVCFACDPFPAPSRLFVEDTFPGNRDECRGDVFGELQAVVRDQRGEGKLAVASSAEAVGVEPRPQPAFAALEVDSATGPSPMGSVVIEAREVIR